MPRPSGSVIPQPFKQPDSAASQGAESCIFCRIVAREAPATIILETEAVLAIAPLNPVSRGHTLLIPRRHYVDLFDIEDDAIRDLASTAQGLSRQVVAEHGASGVNLLHASGADAQQSVFHFHLHLVPRYPADGLDLWLHAAL